MGAVLAVALHLCADAVTALSLAHQVLYIVLSGAGMGLMRGTALVTGFRNHLYASLVALGMPAARAHDRAASISPLGQGSGTTIPRFVQADFAHATSSVLMAMSWVMVAAAVVAFVGLRGSVPGSAVARRRLFRPAAG